MEQVLPESVLRHVFGQVSVRSGDKPESYRCWCCRTNTNDLAFLKGAKEFHLRGLGELADLIETHLPLVKHIVFQVAVHFPRHVDRDELARALEAGETVIARANHRIVYPSRVQLIAAMNPCRCGRANEPGFACRQGRNCADRYQARVSGPLLDRIDLQIEVPTVTAADLIMPPAAEGSDTVRARVLAARTLQNERYAGPGGKGVRTNADCAGPLLEEIAAPGRAGMTLLREAAETLRLSARGYHRTLRVARTLADLDGAKSVARVHIAEALSYRGETLKRQIAA